MLWQYWNYGDVSRTSKIEVKPEPEVKADDHFSISSSDVSEHSSHGGEVQWIPPLSNALHATSRSNDPEESSNSLILDDRVEEVEIIGESAALLNLMSLQKSPVVPLKMKVRI